MSLKSSFFGSLILVMVGACSSPVEPQLSPEASILVHPEKNTECNTGIPINGNTSIVNFQWNASNHTDSYEIIVQELDTGLEIKDQSVVTEKEITLKTGTAYQWSVISKSNASDQTAESEIWRFYNSGDGIINHAPFPANIIQPVNGSSLDLNNNVTLLKWSGSDVDNDIAAYEVIFGSENPPSMSMGEMTNSNMEVNVTAGKTYYWKVKTIDLANNVSESEVFWFKTN